MKTIFYLIMLFCHFSINIYPQQGWFHQNSGTENSLYGVSFIDANNGWVVGWRTILKTTDGGKNWISQISDTTASFIDVSFIDENNGWVVGFNGTILRTTDGGENWVHQVSGTSHYLQAVCFTDANNGTVVGGDYLNGIILKTTDGGNNWVHQYSNTTGGLNGVSFIDKSNGWAVGWSGTILGTNDGGESWIPQNSGTTATLNGVNFIDANTGTAVGSTILRTTDGGVTWTEQSGGPSHNLLTGISFVDSKYGTTVGLRRGFWVYSFHILQTTDGGKVWTEQISGTNFALYAVSFTSHNTGTAVGSGGIILRIEGDVTSINEEQPALTPTNFLLSQNYPNPFNPSTTISWQSPVGSWQTLKVYDLLGREVATLVDEFKPAGRYEVEFDASNLSSGTYFYRLTAGEDIETKKLILLK